MPVVAADLELFNCVNRPTDDVSTVGGAIDTTMRPILTQPGAAAKMAFQSDNGADTQNVAVVGRDAAGHQINETLALTGVTEALTVKTYARVLSVTLSVAATGNITMKQGSGGTLLFTMTAGLKGGAALFLGSISSGSAPLTRYDKVFWKNTNGASALLSAAHQLAADATGLLEVGIAAAKGDSATIANRLAAPPGISFVGIGVSGAVPTDELDSGEYVGVWISETLPTNEVPHNASMQLQLSGATA